jgi:hypothetical protein
MQTISEWKRAEKLPHDATIEALAADVLWRVIAISMIPFAISHTVKIVETKRTPASEKFRQRLIEYGQAVDR